MIIVCKFHDPSVIGSRDFHDPSVIGSRDTEGGPRSPPQSQIDQKSPVWIGLMNIHLWLLQDSYQYIVLVAYA